MDYSFFIPPYGTFRTLTSLPQVFPWCPGNLPASVFLFFRTPDKFPTPAFFWTQRRPLAPQPLLYMNSASSGFLDGIFRHSQSKTNVALPTPLIFFHLGIKESSLPPFPPFILFRGHLTPPSAPTTHPRVLR